MENSNHTAHTANPFSVKFVENQKNQIKNLTGALDKALSMSQNNAVGTFETAAKVMTDLIQTNMDIATSCFELSIKPSFILSGEKTSHKEMEEQAGLFNDQVVALLKINTTTFESILRQFDTMAKSVIPLSEPMKTEMDKAVELSINTMRTLIDSYINIGDQGKLVIVEERTDEPEVVAKTEENKTRDTVVGITKEVAVAINKKMQDEANVLDTVWGAMDGLDKSQKHEITKNHKKINSLKKHSDM